MTTTAIDIDLNNFTVVDRAGAIWAHKAPWSERSYVLPRISQYGLVLIEIAGPVMHHAESHSHRRWMIFNVAAAVQLAHMVGLDRARFSTSTTWTKGYKEEDRHALAGIMPLKYTLTKKGKRTPIYADAHDIRECKCMLYFHAHAPNAWVTLDEFLTALI